CSTTASCAASSTSTSTTRTSATSTTSPPPSRTATRSASFPPSQGADMADESEPEVPDGAAVFPLIPAELGIHPLLLATLHAVVFLVGSSEEVVEPAAGEEALQYLVTYLQRLNGRQLDRVREDIAALVDYARKEDWARADLHFLKTFLAD